MDHKKHILIIEDEPIIRNILSRMLGKINIVTAVDNARDAIKALEGIDFDVVLSDYDLRDGLNGETVLAWIKRERPQLQSKFIFYSSSEEALHMGVPCIVKPAPRQEIEQAIASIH